MAKQVSGHRGEFSFTAMSGATLTQAQRVNMHINQWDATLTQDDFDATPFDPTTAAKESGGGMHQIAGTASGWIDNAAMPWITNLTTGGLIPAAANGYMKLIGVGSETTALYGFGYGFVPHVTSIRVGLQRIGTTQLVVTFKSSGAITSQNGTT